MTNMQLTERIWHDGAFSFSNLKSGVTIQRRQNEGHVHKNRLELELIIKEFGIGKYAARAKACNVAFIQTPASMFGIKK